MSEIVGNGIQAAFLEGWSSVQSTYKAIKTGKVEDGEVYLPAIYAADDPMTDALRLGRETDWRQIEPGPVRGVGQRLFMMGDDAVAMMDLGNIRFGA